MINSIQNTQYQYIPKYQLDTHTLDIINDIYNHIYNCKIISIFSTVAILSMMIIIIYFQIYHDFAWALFYACVIISIIYINVMMFIKRNQKIKINNEYIFKLHQYMNEVMRYLNINLQLLKDNKLFKDETYQNILIILRLFNIDYNAIQQNMPQYLIILSHSEFAKYYINCENIVNKIVNHHNFYLAQYILQSYITQNYNNSKHINKLFTNPHLYQYWAVADVLNYNFISEYMEYFNSQYTVMNSMGYISTKSLNIITAKHLKIYNKIVENNNSILWVRNNIVDIVKYYSAFDMEAYLYQVFKTNPKIHVMYMARLINCNNKIIKYLITIVQFNTIGFWQYVYYIHIGLFNKYPMLISAFEGSYKTETFMGKVRYLILHYMIDIYTSLWGTESKNMMHNPQFQSSYFKTI